MKSLKVRTPGQPSGNGANRYWLIGKKYAQAIEVVGGREKKLSKMPLNDFYKMYPDQCLRKY